MTVLDALETILLLKKTYRQQASMIKSEDELKSFLNSINIASTAQNIQAFKLVIPTIYHLQNYINSIDSELNIKEILRNNNGTKLKRLRNIPNFSRTMKNFDSANFFIIFTPDKAKAIAVRFNENWIAPKKETPILLNNSIRLKTFNNIIEDLKFYRLQQLKSFIKTDDNSKLTPELIATNEHKISYKDFEWNISLEQAYEIFTALYGFKPTESNNNGLYTIILEFNNRFFGKVNPPVHELNNIETTLVKAGISKNNKKPKIWLNLVKVFGKEFSFDFYINTTKLKTIKLFFDKENLFLKN